MYIDACEHNPKQLSIDGVIRLLEVDEAHIQGDFPRSSELMQSAHDEQHADCQARWAKAALISESIPSILQ